MTTITMTCRYGAIRHELLGLPGRVSICHCRDCQPRAGTQIAKQALMMPADNLKTTLGEPAMIKVSGDTFRRFC